MTCRKAGHELCCAGCQRHKTSPTGVPIQRVTIPLQSARQHLRQREGRELRPPVNSVAGLKAGLAVRLQEPDIDTLLDTG